MIAIHCLHSLAEAEGHRAAMTALNRAAVQPDPFSSFAYFDRHLGHRLAHDDPAAPPFQLWLLLALRDGKLVGYAALKRTVTRVFGVPAARVDWLTDHAVACPRLVVRSEDAAAVSEALCRYLLGRSREWSLLEFQQQPVQGGLAKALDSQLGQSHTFRRWPNLTQWSVDLAGHSIASYYAALSSRFRSNVSRQMRGLFATGEVSVVEATGDAVVRKLYALYRGILPCSWKTSLGETAETRPGDTAKVWAVETAMPITVQLLLLDGFPIAGLVSGNFAEATYALEMAYDERYAALAPGQAMMFFGLQRYIRDGAKRCELLGGFGYYKHRWLAEPMATESVQIYRRGTPNDWHRMFGDALRWRQSLRPDRALNHNPSRRAAGVRDVEEVMSGDERAYRQRQRERMAALRHQPGVLWQSGALLASGLPFSLGSQKSQPPKRPGSVSPVGRKNAVVSRD